MHSSNRQCEPSPSAAHTPRASSVDSLDLDGDLGLDLESHGPQSPGVCGQITSYDPTSPMDGNDDACDRSATSPMEGVEPGSDKGIDCAARSSEVLQHPHIDAECVDAHLGTSVVASVGLGRTAGSESPDMFWDSPKLSCAAAAVPMGIDSAEEDPFECDLAAAGPTGSSLAAAEPMLPAQGAVPLDDHKLTAEELPALSAVRVDKLWI